MNRVVSQYPDTELRVILYNLSTHKPKHNRWLTRHPQVYFHYTPIHTSWLNPVERWFAQLTEKQLRRDIHRSTQLPEEAIYQYLQATNENPKPFIWTKTADEILANLAGFCA